jgi:hydrogenase nickel incorporation protein HypB
MQERGGNGYGLAHGHVHVDGHGHHHHHHDHAHDHGHSHHGHGGNGATRTVEVLQSLMDKNDRLAERNRGFFLGRGLIALNLMSSPGAGKTTLVEKTLEALPEDLRAAVLIGDLETDNDAQRVRAKGAPVVQLVTGTACHLDAEMVANGLDALELDGCRLVFLENVGNLVCPASYDLGETARVVLFSVTEGEDKPLKYPPAFKSADLVLLTKTDLAEAVEFDREAALRNIREVAPQARILELSARSGEGWDDWLEALRGYVPAR